MKKRTVHIAWRDVVIVILAVAVVGSNLVWYGQSMAQDEVNQFLQRTVSEHETEIRALQASGG